MKCYYHGKNGAHGLQEMCEELWFEQHGSCGNNCPGTAVELIFTPSKTKETILASSSVDLVRTLGRILEGKEGTNIKSIGLLCLCDPSKNLQDIICDKCAPGIITPTSQKIWQEPVGLQPDDSDDEWCLIDKEQSELGAQAAHETEEPFDEDIVIIPEQNAAATSLVTPLTEREVELLEKAIDESAETLEAVVQNIPADTRGISGRITTDTETKETRQITETTLEIPTRIESQTKETVQRPEQTSIPQRDGSFLLNMLEAILIIAAILIMTLITIFLVYQLFRLLYRPVNPSAFYQ